VTRFQHVTTRLGIVGASALIIGSSLVAGVIAQSLTSSAFADTTPYEEFCPGTPVGNIVLNDVVVTGSLSPASPTPGQQFNLTGFQTQEQLPADVARDAAAAGLTSLTGTVTTTIDATGATPSSMSTGALPFDIPIPNPIPASGMTLTIPSTPATVGPFTATSANISISAAPDSQTTFIDGDGIGLIALHCASYLNDTLPSGYTNTTPPGLPISPVIATAGQVTPPAPPTLTGPYELYCPHTPVGDLVFNDVVTTATISPGTLSAGDQFQVTGYQTKIPLPAGVVSAAAGLGNGGFDGMAASAVDAYGGATPSQMPTGSMSFNVPIPSAVPASGLPVDFPSSPMTVGPFTANGGPMVIAQDQSTVVVAALSSKAFTMSCTAYANDSVAVSGSTGTAPSGPPIRPVIATASASGTSSSTTTTTAQPVPPSTATGPYELYCPSTPVGNIVLNDTTTTASISATSLTQGQQFQLDNLQTQFSIPQAVAQQAENLGLTQISGNASLFINTTGVAFAGTGPIAVASSGSSGGGTFSGAPITTTTTTAGSVTVTTSSSPPIVGPIPYPYPYPVQFGDFVDMPFSVTLPNPVPASGVQFTATPLQGSNEDFTAIGGPIAFDINDVNLHVSEFGDNFGLFCTTYPNDSVPTGISATTPSATPIQPVIAAANATYTPAPPSGGPYELFCPGSPVGNIVMNDATTSGTLSDSSPAPGQQFTVTGYQTTVNIPASVVRAAQALGNNLISGSATTQIDATGATPATSQSGPLSFSVPIPSPVPSTGLALAAPTTPGTLGPFTATGGAITITQAAQVGLTLLASGSDVAIPFTLTCTSYPNDSEPLSGLTSSPPPTSPISPVIAANVTVPPVTPPPPGSTTGAYELYCPGTPVGNIVLNNVTTTATIPSDLSAGQQFNATNFQTALTLPSSIVSAAAALGNPSITGTAALGVDATGATPASVPSGDLPFNVPIPSPVPPQGLAFDLPSPPTTIGPFTATGSTVTLALDPNVSLSLTVSGSTLNLTCRPYPNNSEPTGITAVGPTGPQVAPVIVTSGGSTPPPPITTIPPTTVPTSPTTTGSPDASAEITQAFETLFDPNSSIADKVAVIQGGASIETALNDAFSSSIASSEGGATVDSITFPDDSGCAQAGLSSPCAAVTYDILGTGGTPILPGNRGFAVQVDGSWLIATNTVCNLLGLFYSAEGKTGTPPGCPSTNPTGGPGTTVVPTTVSPAPASPAPTTEVPPGETPTTQAPTTSAAPYSSPARGTAPATGASHSGTADPATVVNPAPVVRANSGSLAFTGVGQVAQWLAVVGGALMVLGFALLTMVDAPRRIRYRLAHLGQGRRRLGRWLVGR